MRILLKNMPEIKEKFTESTEPVSKSQRRRDALELKALARDLIAMSPSRRARVPLDEPLRAAIDEARRIRSNVARKRQLQYVAKLLRHLDAEPILAAIEALENDSRQLTARHHRAEAWRDHLLESGDDAVGELLAQRRGADAQAIRQCIRKARVEAERDRPPAASRALFRLLREMEENEPLPPIGVNST
jgi:ribosome-associated protein